ncbi:hypothetical protein [Microbacterium laevaniformans]|uniref:hypothetical protein n=1 Tax=Microbacterium laevaniformans TaxID=36807 RepID=UPI00362C3410
MASAIAVDNDMQPSPRVTIDIDPTDLDPATSAAIVVQISQWGEVPVNRMPRLVAGGLIVVDYEAPLGVPLIYRVRQFDASGADIGLSTLSLAGELEAAFGKVVISDPMAPANAVILDADAAFAGVRTRTRPTKLYQAGGSTFAMSGLYSAMQGVNLNCFTDTAEDAIALSKILEQPLILVRAHPRTGIPGAFYATVPEVIADSTDQARFGRLTNLWQLVADQLSRPAIEIQVAIYSYDLFKQYLDTKYPPEATYDDAAREWTTYIDALRNPPSDV